MAPPPDIEAGLDWDLVIGLCGRMGSGSGSGPRILGASGIGSVAGSGLMGEVSRSFVEYVAVEGGALVPVYDVPFSQFCEDVDGGRATSAVLKGQFSNTRWRDGALRMGAQIVE